MLVRAAGTCRRARREGSAASEEESEGELEAVRPNRAEFDLAALRHDPRVLRALAGPESKIIAALEANACGHGAAEVARALADDGGAFAIATGSFEDALAIRGAGVRLPIPNVRGRPPGGRQRQTRPRSEYPSIR